MKSNTFWTPMPVTFEQQLVFNIVVTKMKNWSIERGWTIDHINKSHACFRAEYPDVRKATRDDYVYILCDSGKKDNIILHVHLPHSGYYNYSMHLYINKDNLNTLEHMLDGYVRIPK